MTRLCPNGYPLPGVECKSRRLVAVEGRAGGQAYNNDCVGTAKAARDHHAVACCVGSQFQLMRPNHDLYGRPLGETAGLRKSPNVSLDARLHDQSSKEVCPPHETSDEAGPWSVIDRLRVAELFQSTAVQHADSIGDQERFLMVVGDKHGGCFEVT